MTATCFALASALILAQTGGAPGDAGKMETTSATIVFVHASPDSPAVSVWVNGKETVKELAFAKPSAVTRLPAGESKIEFKAADKVVLMQNTNLLAGKFYTVAATGKNAALKGEVITAKHTPGKAHVILFHASPDAGPVDVKVDGAETTKGLVMGKSWETSLAAGKHEFALLAGSTEPTLNKSWDFKADTCYCLLATGMARGEPKLDFTVVAHNMGAGH